MLKVFLGVPTYNGFGGSPVDHFSMGISYQAFRDVGVDGNPESASGSVSIDIPLGSIGSDVYQSVFDSVVAEIENLGWGTAAKTDVFGLAPIPVTALLPDFPVFA